jgi:mono/diheme cytochrome c family protein
MNIFKSIGLVFIFLLISSCGDSKKPEEKSIYKRVKTEKKQIKEVNNVTPVDLNNKGIGPIESMRFDETINQELVTQGATAFKQKCTACHKTNAKLIGPAMQGIYERRSPEWVMNILLNPTEMLKKDHIASALLKEYNNIQMLNQNLSEAEARAIAEYLRTL